jgi:hypothetical protein
MAKKDSCGHKSVAIGLIASNREAWRLPSWATALLVPRYLRVVSRMSGRAIACDTVGPSSAGTQPSYEFSDQLVTGRRQ